MTDPQVSVCIPVRNEEKNLPACLKSLGSTFNEVVVVDSGSTDHTREIALEFNATLVEFQWDGKFPKKRNWMLQNHQFRNPWVLFLDADERLTPQFLDELTSTLNDTPHVGFWISFTNWFAGQPLIHGDTFRKLALFRSDAGLYEKFPEDWWSHLDMEIHEHPVLNGSVGVMSSRLQHHDYRGLANYIARHNEYSTWEANRFAWLQAADVDAWAALTSRQRFKYRNLDRWWLSWVYFAVSYVLKFGFLDGRAGFMLAAMKRRYFSDIRMKILEARTLLSDIVRVTPSLMPRAESDEFIVPMRQHSKSKHTTESGPKYQPNKAA